MKIRSSRRAVSLISLVAVAVPFGTRAVGAQPAPLTPPAAAPVEQVPENAASAEYKLRAGDVINISVWGHEEFSMPSITVRPDGKISYPTIGDVYVVDTTPPQLSRILSMGISKYLRNPKVVVTLVSSNAEKYFVTGSVGKPGSFPLTTGTGVREAVVAAGDLSIDANDQTAAILRHGQRIPVDLAGALRGDATKNLPLLPGDTLEIDKALITLVGEVNGTGQQPLRRGTTLRQALAAVGDPRDTADIERIQILRGGETIIANLRDITADPSKDVPLLPGDMIKVDKLDDRTVPIFITGSVGHQGMYRFLPGRRDTLQDAINWAGGVGGDADLSRVKVHRSGPDGEATETSYDLRTVEGRGIHLQANDYVEVPKRKHSQAAGIAQGALGFGLTLYTLFRNLR